MSGNYILGFVEASEPEPAKQEAPAPARSVEPVPDDVVVEYMSDDGEWKMHRSDVPHNVLLIKEALHECARATRRRVRATQGGKVLSLK